MLGLRLFDIKLGFKLKLRPTFFKIEFNFFQKQTGIISNKINLEILNEFLREVTKYHIELQDIIFRNVIIENHGNSKNFIRKQGSFAYQTIQFKFI